MSIPMNPLSAFFTPKGNKIGGQGARVKRIKTSDDWGNMIGVPDLNNTYGQEYEYLTTAANGETISSGVATFEPMLGGEENPFYVPIWFEKENLLAQDEEYYITGPIAPFAYPAANVGYSQVKVSNLKKISATDQKEVKRRATGHIIKEFYTAKDFPTVFNYH